jgi:inosose dehydratase
LSKKLKEFGLVMASGWWSGMLRSGTVEEEIERIESYLNMFIGCGTDIMFYGEIDGSIQDSALQLSLRPSLSEEEFKSYGERLSKLAAYTKTRGVKLCFHHHMGTVVQTADDVDLLMANTSDDLGLLVDTGHMVFAGGDPSQLVRKHSKRVCYVHCKDLRKDELQRCLDEDWAFTRAIREGVFTVPGDGFVDFGSFFKELAAIKYGGWIVVEAEQDPRTANPIEYAILGRECLERLIDQHSFTILDE